MVGSGSAASQDTEFGAIEPSFNLMMSIRVTRPLSSIRGVSLLRRAGL
jgi:hypothetical protein